MELLTRTLTLQDLAQAFLLARQQLRPGTLRYYRTCLKNLEWYARVNGWPEDVREINRGHIREFLAYIGRESNRWGYNDPARSSSRPASPATVHHYGRVTKNMFHWASDEEQYLEEDPTRRLRLGSPRYKEVEPYSDEEVAAMLAICEEEFRNRSMFLGSRNKAIISVFADTGLRLSELASITLGDLDPKLQRIRVVGKGAKMRVVPLENESRRALNRYLLHRPQEGRWLWLNEDGERLAMDSIKIMVQRVKAKAGIRSGGGVHRFRHYFATRYLEAGGNLNSLRLLLGHATLYMVLRYSKYVDVGRALSEHEQFSPLDRLYQGQNHNRREESWGWKY